MADGPRSGPPLTPEDIIATDGDGGIGRHQEEDVSNSGTKGEKTPVAPVSSIAPPKRAPVVDYTRGRGHFFTRKTFHRPTHCHHCTDMLWGLIGQGYVCEGT